MVSVPNNFWLVAGLIMIFNVVQLFFIDCKGNRTKEHVMPLSKTTLAILEKVRKTTQDLNWPFTYTGGAPLTLNIITIVNSYQKSKKA